MLNRLVLSVASLPSLKNLHRTVQSRRWLTLGRLARGSSPQVLPFRSYFTFSSERQAMAFGMGGSYFTPTNLPAQGEGKLHRPPKHFRPTSERNQRPWGIATPNLPEGSSYDSLAWQQKKTETCPQLSQELSQGGRFQRASWVTGGDPAPHWGDQHLISLSEASSVIHLSAHSIPQFSNNQKRVSWSSRFGTQLVSVVSRMNIPMKTEKKNNASLENWEAA